MINHIVLANTLSNDTNPSLLPFLSLAMLIPVHTKLATEPTEPKRSAAADPIHLIPFHNPDHKRFQNPGFFQLAHSKVIISDL